MHPSPASKAGRSPSLQGTPRKGDASHRSRARPHSLIECSDRRAPGETESAICVQRLDDSLNSAIHTRYRSLLRSSSMHEPRGPPLEVVHFNNKHPSRQKRVWKKKKDDKGARGEEVDPDFDVHPRGRKIRPRTWPTPHRPSRQLRRAQYGAQSTAKLMPTVMILPQVHLRKPCYDFYFL